MELIISNEYDFDLLNFNKNKKILIAINNGINILNYIDNNINIIYEDRLKAYEHVYEKMNKHQLIGNIILEDLAKKVFHPQRLLKICNDYNIQFDDLVEIY